MMHPSTNQAGADDACTAGTTMTELRNKLFPGPSIGDVLAAKDREIAALRAEIERRYRAQRTNNISLRCAVEKMHKGYQYGCGYYNQDIFIEGLKGLFAAFDLKIDGE